MKHLCLIITLMTAMFFSGCSYTSSDTRILSDAQWIEDIDFLDNKLRYFHPDLFKYISEDKWNENIERLKLEVPQLSDNFIKLRISQIISSIGDSHTALLSSELLSPIPSTLPPDENPTYIEGIVEFPIKCDYFDDGLRVIECDSKYSEVLGYKLISINNVNINNIISDISTLISYDYENEQKGMAYVNQILNVYEILNFFNIVDSNMAEYVFENDDKEQINLSIQAKKNVDIEYVSINKKSMKTSVIPEGSDKNYWYTNFNDDNILFFKFNRFITDTRGEKYPNFDKFLEGLLEEINKNNYEKFIIDLRENRGGSPKVLNALIENINYRTNLNGEDIYIITGKTTGSASVLLAYNMQSKKGATVVGEVTGGNINLFSSGGRFELPNSKLKPTVSSNSIVNKNGYNGGVIPDIKVIQNYKDYINGIDTCYEYIKNID
ncbi:MAG: S41 family peptidase [Paraclostridium sp.]